MSEIISLEDILKQLYAISGILIDVYDLEGHSVARYPDTGAYFCSLVTRNSQGCERCGRDNREAFATVREEHKVHIYRCHMGLYEAVFPLYHYGRLAGYMMTGQMLEKREGAAEEVMQKARQMNLGSEEEIAEGVKKLVRIIPFLAIVLIVIQIINVSLGTSFFFINGAGEGNPLSLLEDTFGRPWYLIPAFFFVVILWCVMYSVSAFAFRRKEKKEERTVMIYFSLIV